MAHNRTLNKNLLRRLVRNRVYETEWLDFSWCTTIIKAKFLGNQTKSQKVRNGDSDYITFFILNKGKEAKN